MDLFLKDMSNKGLWRSRTAAKSQETYIRGNRKEYGHYQHTGLGDIKRPTACSTIPDKIPSTLHHKKGTFPGLQNVEAFMYQGVLQKGGKPKLKDDYAAGRVNKNSESTVVEIITVHLANTVSLHTEQPSLLALHAQTPCSSFSQWISIKDICMCTQLRTCTWHLLKKESVMWLNNDWEDDKAHSGRSVFSVLRNHCNNIHIKNAWLVWNALIYFLPHKLAAHWAFSRFHIKCYRHENAKFMGRCRY